MTVEIFRSRIIENYRNSGDFITAHESGPFPKGTVEKELRQEHLVFAERQVETWGRVACLEHQRRVDDNPDWRDVHLKAIDWARKVNSGAARVFIVWFRIAQHIRQKLTSASVR